MKRGYLSDHFTAIAYKRLSAVEVDLRKSNQHEFNGSAALKRVLGSARRKLEVDFMFLTDDEPPITERVQLTWYDSRENVPTRSAEYRLYFPGNPVMDSASVNDLLVIGERPGGGFLFMVVKASSSIERQISWLFQISNTTDSFQEKHDEFSKVELEYTAQLILEEIGIEPTPLQPNYLEQMLFQFDGRFPSTKVFSEFARNTIETTSNDPDSYLINLMEWEESLFRTYEAHFVEKRLAQGFEDVDDFISYSLSVQNRRKSRVGHAFEIHVEHIFSTREIRFERGALIDDHSRPDFLFPGSREYRDPAYPEVNLAMLGVKSTCKDRWRQVLAEARRIPRKHLLTLQRAISENQTDEMRANNLQLVVPTGFQATYSTTQREWLLGLGDFIETIEERQRLQP